VQTLEQCITSGIIDAGAEIDAGDAGANGGREGFE
jgi:hypothetical protein